MIIFVFMLFFADSAERAVVQATMMGGVAIVITSTLLLLWFLDHPYHSGAGGLRPVAMERTIRILDQEAAGHQPEAHDPLRRARNQRLASETAAARHPAEHAPARPATEAARPAVANAVGGRTPPTNDEPSMGIQRLSRPFERCGWAGCLRSKRERPSLLKSVGSHSREFGIPRT